MPIAELGGGSGTLPGLACVFGGDLGGIAALNGLGGGAVVFGPEYVFGGIGRLPDRARVFGFRFEACAGLASGGGGAAAAAGPVPVRVEYGDVVRGGGGGLNFCAGSGA